MATSMNTLSVRPQRKGGNQGRSGGNNRPASAAAGPPVPQGYFAPERAYWAAREPVATKALQMAKMAVALVNAEKMFFDVSGNVNPVNVPVAQSITLVGEGDDDPGRTGRSIRAKSLDIRLHFYADATATASQCVRVFIVKDNDPRGLVPTVGLLFEGGTASVDGMPVLSSAQGRFKWLYDSTFVLGIIAGGDDSKVMNISLKLDHHIEFVGSSNATTSLGQGNLFLYVLTDKSTVATGTFYSRLRFYDN